MDQTEPERAESRHVSLLNEHREDGSWLNLDAYLDSNGTLRIVGQDLGAVTEFISSDGEYEYFYTIAAEDVPALVNALGGQPGADVLDVLARNWSGDASYGVGRTIESSGVKYHFANYF
ncbi:hypothetical protein [Mycolicibacterium alvei]|uniref:Uncharacterized protein n=1 Tax=Mycolicibacterium alvei TaxID=67081 RepID=A0A6N4USL6_9MYCO|nr:hypothetical protein [Mycolicibacterium alvei]MCV7002236.1 hypothetical protein [Mycolicibacterium alvei]BBX27418.1 hypothetical protein MALV_25430 [Mycolicibacterium alvei]